MRDEGTSTSVPRVVVVADDLTGAADAGAGFATSGASTIVLWPESFGARGCGAEVVAVDVGSRAMRAEEARMATAGIVRSVRAAGTAVIYKKCDSLLRGHIGVEVAATLGAWYRPSMAIAALAFPDADRTTVHGRQQVRGETLEPPIAALLESAGLTVEVADLECVRSGRLRSVMRMARRRGVDAIVCDAVHNADLAAIARDGLDGGEAVVWVGTGGLARALAAAIPSGSRSDLDGQVRTHRRGPVLIVCGSVSPIAREQAARAAAAAGVAIELSTSMLFDNAPGERASVAREIASHLARHTDVVITTAAMSASGDREIDRRVANALAELLRPFAEVVGGLVATGGDTATAMLKAWGVRGLRLTRELEPGVIVSIGVAEQPVVVVTKAGAFGGPDALVRARESVHTMIDEDAGAA